MADNQYIPKMLGSNNLRREVLDRSVAGTRLHALDRIGGSREKMDQAGIYKVDQLVYPADLLTLNEPGTDNKYKKEGSNEYGGNYVVFYINVSDDSKLLKDTSVYADKFVADWTPKQQNRLVGQNISKGQAELGSVGQAIIAGGVGGAIMKGDISGAIKGAGVVGGLQYVGVEAIATQAGTFSRQMKRLSTAIALYIPSTLQTKYGINYQEEDTAAFQMAMRGGETLAKALSGNLAKNANVSDDVKAMLGAVALNNVAGKDAISSITGIATNPKKEQIFKGVDVRTWSFDYQFFPRNEKELNNLENIIYTFKLHMQPEFKDTNNFLYLYPSEFDIVYYHGTEENLHLPRHSSCVLTDLSINYSPQQSFTSFKDGAPAQINVTMTFKELIQMSKERIQEGY